MSRVVISGIGVLASIGSDHGSFWENVLNGTNGIHEISCIDTSRYKVHCGGEVRNFKPDDFVVQQKSAEMGRTSQLAIAATAQALSDSGLDIETIDPRNAGVCFGTTTGEAPVIEKFNDCLVDETPDRVDRNFARHYPCHMIAAHVAREFRFGGVNLVIPAACAAGNYAIAHAFDAIRSGRADVMIAGGADAFSRITYTGFARLGAISPDFCRPFDKNRRGMIPGEGAAALMMESLESAVARGAGIYAEVAGYGLSCDAHHMTAAHPDGAGAARAMTQALRMSKLNSDDVNYISAHGTGTKLSDRIETLAVKNVFNGNAYKIPVSSIKSMIGHTMGAASAIEAAVCALAVCKDHVPPTINWETRDPDCDLDYVVSGARSQPVRVAMNNAYAFGGYNASVVFTKMAG